MNVSIPHGMQVLVSPRGRRAGVKIPASFRCQRAGWRSRA